MALKFLNDGYFAGKVGIGTASPSSILELAGTTPILTLSSTAVNVAQGIEWRNSGTLDAYIKQGPSTAEFEFNVGRNTTWGGDFKFVTDTYDAYRITKNQHKFFILGSAKMTIDGVGNVGIGTTSPSFGTGGGLQITNATQANLRFTDTSASTFITDLALSNDDFYIINRAASGQLKFRVNASNEAMTIDSNGNVGIGTTAPSQKLHISGNMRLTGAFRDRLNSQGAANYVLTSTGSNGTQWVDASGSSIIGGPYLPLTAGSTKPLSGNLYFSAAASYIFGGDDEILAGQDGNAYYYATGNGQNLTKPVFIGDNNTYIRFNSGNSERMRITNTGNVGIGTTSPGYKLEVAGTARITSALTLGGNVNNRIEGTGSSLDFKSNGEYYFRKGANTNLTILSGGNVGIGTTSPEELLHIKNGDAGVTPYDLGTGLNIEGTTSNVGINIVSSNTGQGRIYFASPSSNTAGAIEYNHNATLSSGFMKFRTGNSETMRIDGSGNVGIGTTSPSVPLEVNGVNTTSGQGEGLRVTRPGVSSQYISIDEADGSKHRIRAIGDKPFEIFSSSSSYGINFFTNSTQKATILANGRVGIGTTSPTANLHVYTSTNSSTVEVGRGAGRSSIKASADADGGYLALDSSGNGLILNHYSSDNVWLVTGGGNVGVGNTGPSQKLHITGNLRVTGTYYDSNNTPGTSGQILSSTATGTDWIDGSAIPGVPGGSGTVNTIPLWTPDGDTLGNSIITQPTSAEVRVAGTLKVNSTVTGYSSTKIQTGGFGDSQSGINILNSTTGYGYILFGDGSGADLYRGQIAYKHGDDFMAFNTAGSERIRISSNGSVGINSTSTSYKLDVGGNARFLDSVYVNTSTGSGGLFVTRLGGASESLKIYTTDSSSYLDVYQDENQSGYGNLAFRADDTGNNNGYLWFGHRSGGEAMRIIDNGNVGIGTTSPGVKLHVSGDGALNATSTQSLLRLERPFNSGVSFAQGADIAIGRGNTYPSTQMRFILDNGTNSPANPQATVMALDSSGNVGIGLTNPVDRLDLYDADDNVGIYFHTATSGTGGGNGLRVGQNNANAFVWNYEATPLSLATGGTARLTINATGGIRFNTGYGAGTLVTDASGNITVSSGGGAGGPYLPLAGGTMTGNVRLNDSVQLQLGSSNDAYIMHNGTNTYFVNSVGDLEITNDANDKDIIFRSDDGSGGIATYFYLDGSLTNGTTTLGATRFPDNSKIFMGTDGDLVFNHDGTHGYITNITGDLTIDSQGDDLILKAADDFIVYVAGTEIAIQADSDGRVALRYDNTVRFQTTSTGISVTGSLVVSNDITATGDLDVRDIDARNLTLSGKGTSAATITSDGSSTLTTKGYVNSLITGATIYRGTWDPDVSLNSGYGNPNLNTVTQTSGYYYICSDDGAATPNGPTCEPDSWNTGDWVIWNDDVVDCAGTGTGAWQKIDNSSVLSGVGTGQTVALWEGASSVTDSETLGNSILTQQSDDEISILSTSATTGQLGKLTIYGYDDGDTNVKNLQLNVNNGGDSNIIASGPYLWLDSANYIASKKVHIFQQDIFMYNNKHIRFLDGPGDSWNDVLGVTSADIVQIGAIASFNTNLGEVAIYSNNTEAIRIDVDQNVGIGTASPGTKLTISASNSGAANNNTLRFVDTDVTTQANQSFGKIEFETKDTNNPGVNAFINAFAEGTGGTGALSFGTGSGGSTEKMRITSGGNVGIGATAPLRKLHVVGNFAVNAATNEYYGVNITGGEGSNPNILIGDWHNSSANIKWDSSGNYLRIDAQHSTSGAPIIFSGNDEAIEYMRISSTGNVGIGTTVTTAALNVLDSTSTAVKATRIGNDTTSIYSYATQADAVLAWTCGSYYNAEVVITASQTNGGDYNNLYIRGIWSNNHTSHHWDELEHVGGLTGSTITMSVGQNGSTTNSGRLELDFNYISASFATLNIRVTDFYGSHSYTIT